MSILPELRKRFRHALEGLVADPRRATELLDSVQRSQVPKFGDYQANFAMPLGKELKRPPRQVAAEVLARLDVGDLCLAPEIAGPGFINLRVRDDWLAEHLTAAVRDPRLGVALVERPRTYVIDYSAPNVAKPMHVGHIRSTVIGDSLYRTLKFLGHKVISDNHIGDWGTQFGMILYGYKRFCDQEAYRTNPVQELARLYRLVRQLMDYHEAKQRLSEMAPDATSRRAKLENEVATLEQVSRGDEWNKVEQDAKKRKSQVERAFQEVTQLHSSLRERAEAVDRDPLLSRLAAKHPNIESCVLDETAKLHAGDEENRRLWQEFMPYCLEEIDRVYRRLGVKFDKVLGESHYHHRLDPLVKELMDRGIAYESEGAICAFRVVASVVVPMLIRKKDGAFLYSTTDIATVEYRMAEWNPDAILYVVDSRQSLYFENLFAIARRMGYENVELEHVSFGTVLGDDGRPFKTRSGDTVGLEGLLDEAVRRAAEIVSANDDAKPSGAELSAEERKRVAETVGIAALKYADLSQNRTSDYVFSYDKMLAMNGNTATYMQYAYARVRSIFAKGNVDVDALCNCRASVRLDTPAERALGLELLRFGEALDLAVADYRPNQLTAYLFELANRYSTFFENCPVLRAESDELRQSRLLLCDLTARTIRQGLELLGINVVDRM